MDLADIRFLFAYDRWATEKVLSQAVTVPFEDWAESNRIDRRGLGGILAHQLGAHERWRAGWQGRPTSTRREDDPVPGPAELVELWKAEWAILDEYLATLADADVQGPFEDLTLWHTMAHVITHGTQHRSEAAVLLTIMGRSPADLDLIDFAQAQGG